MKTETIKEFLVSLGFDVDENQLGKFEGGIKKATAAVAVFGTAIVGAAAGVTAFVTSVASELDSVANLSFRVNATADEILRLGYVATLSGSSVEAANSSLENLSRIAGEAVVGVGRGALIFEQFGLEARKANGEVKTSVELLEEVGQKVKDLSRAEQTAIFSKLGIDPTLIQSLTEDTSGLKVEFETMYKSLGIDATKATQASAEFMDSVDKLSFVFDSIRKAVAIRFMGQIKNAFDTTRKVFVENAPKIIQAISPVIDLILRIAEAIIVLVGRVSQGVSFVISAFMKLNKFTNGLTGYILAAVAAWKLLNLAFLLTPIGILISLSAALLLLVDDFITFQENGESLIDWSGRLGDSIRFLINFFEMLGLIIVDFAPLVDKVFEAANGHIQDAVRKMKQPFIDFFDFVFEGFKKVAEFAANPVRGVTLATVNTFDNAFGQRNSDISAPRGSGASSLNQTSQNVNQKTEIVVQGSSDPQATARLVAGQQGRVNADLARNLAGVTR